MQGPIRGLSTDPRFLDLRLAPRAVFETELPAGHNVFLYAYEGEAVVGTERKRPARIGRRDCSPTVTRCASRLANAGARVLLLAGIPIGEPVVQYGPFVMNTREEIEQAIADYQSGTFDRDPVARIALAPGA